MPTRMTMLKFGVLGFLIGFPAPVLLYNFLA